MLQGSFVALPTPFTTTGSVDYKSLQQLLAWHLEQDTDGIVILGTTGEAPTLSLTEKLKITEITLDTVNNQIPIIVGSGSNCTKSTLKLSAQFCDLGVKNLMIVTPYYNKPTQQGLIEHYQYLAQNLHANILLYNVPSRTGCDLHPETIQVLAQTPNIIGLKDASCATTRIQAILASVPEDFVLLSGDDASTHKVLTIGGHGAISVTANIAPSAMHKMISSALSADFSESRKINLLLHELNELLFIESNPIPTKWALYKMGLIKTPSLRLPLTTLSTKYQHLIEMLIKDFYQVTRSLYENI